MQVYLRAWRGVGLPQARVGWDHVSPAGVCCFLLGVNELSSSGWSGNRLAGKKVLHREEKEVSSTMSPGPE